MNKHTIIALVILSLVSALVAGAAYYMFPLTSADLGAAGTVLEGSGEQVGPADEPVNSDRGSIDAASFSTATLAPRFSGTARGMELVLVEIVDGDKVLWHSQVPVRNDRWEVIGTLPSATADGRTFKLVIRANGQPSEDVLAHGTLTFRK